MLGPCPGWGSWKEVTQIRFKVVSEVQQTQSKASLHRFVGERMINEGSGFELHLEGQIIFQLVKMQDDF